MVREKGAQTAVLAYAAAAQAPWPVSLCAKALAEVGVYSSAETVRQAVNALCTAGALRRLPRSGPGRGEFRHELQVRLLRSALRSNASRLFPTHSPRLHSLRLLPPPPPPLLFRPPSPRCTPPLRPPPPAARCAQPRCLRRRPRWRRPRPLLALALQTFLFSPALRCTAALFRVLLALLRASLCPQPQQPASRQSKASPQAGPLLKLWRLVLLFRGWRSLAARRASQSA
jgi:hypothetical protein